MKVYFMPRVRAFVTKESPEEMMTRLTSRLGLDKPWAKITQFLSRLLPGDKPEIEIAAVDCAPGAQNRLKIYFRTDLLSYSHMEYLLTLGGSLATADVSTVRVLWAALTDGTPAGSSRYFRSGLIYYELRPDQDSPSSKVYLPVQRYFSNDLAVSKAISRLDHISGFSAANPYPRFAQTVL
jgi:DMATS type aromatic prenyltransferase